MPKIRAPEAELKTDRESVAPPHIEVEPPKPQPEAYLKDGFPNPKAHNVWDYMGLLTDEQWKEHIAYLYRTSPTTMRVQGKPAFLYKFACPVGVDEIAEKYGGRAFLLILKRKKDKVYEERFGIEAAPKFQDNEEPEGVAEEKEKAAAASATTEDLLRKLVTDVITQRDKASAEGKQFNPEAALQNSLNLYGKASEAAIDLVAKQSEKAAAGNGMADKMIGLLLPKLMERLLAPAPDPLTQLAATASLIKELQGEASPAADGPGSWKIALAQSLGAKADSIFERIEKSLAHYSRAQENRAAVMLAGRGFSVRTGPPPGDTAPAAAEPVQTSATMTPAAQPPITPNPTDPATGEPVPQLSMPDFIKGKLIELLFSGKEGDAAAIFAEAMDAPFAEEIARIMKENPEALATDNILAQAVRHPNVKTFCKDYVNYFEEEEPSEAPPPPAGEE